MKYAICILSLFSLVRSASAFSADFESVWSAILAKSPALKSELSEKEASEIQLSRAKGHWAPKLLLNAGVVSTNAPGTTLFSTLGSRSLQASDLSPSLMNYPSRQWFKQGSAIVDWTLFEGGAKHALVKGSALASEGQEALFAARKTELYADLVRDFAKLESLRSERSGIVELKEKLKGLVERYKVGSRDNPVGYSGLLGMRSLLSRLESALAQNDAETASVITSLRIRSGSEQVDESSAPKQDPLLFAKEKLSSRAGANQLSSLRVESMRLQSQAQSEYAKAERAKWLPRVGIFASGNLVSSPRDTGTSTEYGAYLQWELFNASNLGVAREAGLRSAAAEYRASEFSENSKIARSSLQVSLPMLEQNLKRIRESMQITQEQVSVTEKLFRNGSVNALQLAEVLSRRADVIESQRKIETLLVAQIADDYLQNASGL